MSNNKRRNVILNEPPVEKLRHAGAMFDRILIEVKQRTLQGPYKLRLSRKEVDATALWDGTFALWLQQHLGGGEYLLTAYTPDEAYEKIGETWRIAMDGPKKKHVSIGLDGEPLQQGPTGGFGPVMPGMPGGMQGGFQGRPPFAGGPAMPFEDDPQQLPLGASQYSDQVASRYGERESRRYEQSLAKTDDLRSVIDQQTKMIAKLEADRDRERLEAKLEALTTNMMMQRQQPQQAPKTDWAAILGPIATVLGGVIPAMMQAKTAQQSNELQTNLQQMQMQQSMQQQNMQLILSGQQPQKSNLPELLTAIAPIALPLVQSMAEKGSPDTLLALQNTQNQNNLMMLQMVSELMLNQDSDASPQQMIMGILQNAFSAAPDLLNAFRMMSSGNKAAQPLPHPQQHQQAQPNFQDAQIVDVEPTYWDRFREHHPQLIDAIDAVEGLYSQFDPAWGFDTEEWKSLFINLHALANPHDLADELARHVMHLDEIGKLPPMFETLRVNRGGLRNVFSMMPVGQEYPKYADQVTDLILEALTKYGFFGTDAGVEQEPPIDVASTAEVQEPVEVNNVTQAKVIA